MKRNKIDNVSNLHTKPLEMADIFKEMSYNRSNSKQQIYVSDDVYNAIEDKTQVLYGHEFSINKKRDVVKEFLKLPRFVSFEGIQFEPNIFINDSDEMRLVYSVFIVGEDSRHKEQWDKYGCWDNPLSVSPFDNDIHTCDFLWLQEGIQNEEELFKAIERCYEFLLNRKII